MSLPRLLVSAAHKSSGKTTVTTGLAAALSSRAVVVQPFKKGPDYIDPMWLSLATGRPCFNLDPHLSRPEDILARVARSSAGADLALVEGNKGLYDGLALDGSNSNAALAHALEAPVLLVLEARGMTRGIAPLILGYQAFDRQIRIGGVVLNRVGGSRHEAKLRAVIEHYTDVPVLGAVAEDRRLAMTERHLGLQPCAEVDDAARWVADAGRIVGGQLDLDRILSLAATAPDSLPQGGSSPAPRHAGAADRAGAGLRIGIARDRAFGFIYPDDLEAFEAEGCELVFLDLLHDSRLPPLDGLFIGGGFPETALDALEANTSMRAALREAIVGGLPTYAECGGLMLLSRSIRWGQRVAPMVGVIPGDAVMHERPVGRGYVELQEAPAMPWPARAGEALGAKSGSPSGAASSVRGHEFHHASLDGLPPESRFAWRVQRGHGIDGRHDGLCVHRLLASFSHLRDGAGSSWVRRFTAYVRQVRAEAESARTPPRP